MTTDLIRELLMHERMCHAALVDAEKHLTKDKGPENRARERWQNASDWINYYVSREVLAEVDDAV